MSGGGRSRREDSGGREDGETCSDLDVEKTIFGRPAREENGESNHHENWEEKSLVTLPPHTARVIESHSEYNKC